MDNILDKIRDEFFSRLQTNTTWGRNQIKELYTQCERDVLVRNLNNKPVNPIWKEAVEMMKNKAIINPIIPDEEYEEWKKKDYGDDNPFKDDKDINKGYEYNR